MPPKESIERVRQWQIGVGIFTAAIMFVTSGTDYNGYAGFLVILPAWAAIGYVTKLMYSFSNYVRTNFPEFYHQEELNWNRKFWFGKKSLVQVWPYKSWLRDEKGKGVRQRVIDLIPDRDYIQSLQALQKYYRTAIAVAVINFGSLILFSILKLWA
jgi:hypothetical protein